MARKSDNGLPTARAIARWENEGGALGPQDRPKPQKKPRDVKRERPRQDASKSR
ncbi:MAG TPA: hypothetical protein VID67_10930 [Rhizomicrobium sp.]|jgi:hypothetical protein